MNDKINEILNKHLSIITDYTDKKYTGLSNAIIEICELQKQECANRFMPHTSEKLFCLTTKNIADLKLELDPQFCKDCKYFKDNTMDSYHKCSSCAFIGNQQKNFEPKNIEK